MTIQKTLSINGKQTLSGIKEEFNKYYPFLKLEFFRESHIKGRGTSRGKMVLGNMMLSLLQENKSSGNVSVVDNKTVAELEGEFLREYGLNIQVFRKSGNIWLETSSTDDWTLHQQNEEGKNLAEHLKTEKDDPADHDIY